MPKDIITTVLKERAQPEHSPLDENLAAPRISLVA
jgi:hypothetical protein